MTSASTVVVVMGVSGSGKSTVAQLLAERLGWDLQEGDDLHPPANVAKMSAGIPLDDQDRAPWLDAVAKWIDNRVDAGEPGIITCSALKRTYRDRLRSDRPGADVVFVYLRGDRDTLTRRMTERKRHFMPTALLDSQLQTLEPPTPDERSLTVDIGDDPSTIVSEIVDGLEQ